jgi:hypothetical protein
MKRRRKILLLAQSLLYQTDDRQKSLKFERGWSSNGDEEGSEEARKEGG